MKAMRYHSHGSPDVLVHEDAEQPVAGPGQVVVKVAGTAFNLVDAVVRDGSLPDVFPVTLPHIPGIDLAGTVTGTGAGVSGWSAGDRVVAFLPITEPGAAAEYAVVDAEHLTAAPRTGELADAAALPAVGLTAWQALTEYAGLEAGQSILIIGAGGGVGGYAVQLAGRTGATVTAVAGPRDVERLRGYGAARVIDRTATPLPGAVGEERFDVVLNLARTSPEDTARLADLTADGGVFVSTTTPGPEDAGRGVRTLRVYLHPDTAQLAALVARVDAGDLRIHVADRRPLAELPDVHRAAEAGRLPGRTVLLP